MMRQERVDDLIEQAGGVGLFQIFSFVIFVCGLSGIHFLWYGIPLYIKHPIYVCQWANPELHDGTACTAEQICADSPEILSWSVDWQNQESMHNWQQKLDIMCVSKFKVGLLGSSYFIGWCFSLLWAPRLADIYGRKTLFRIT